jgi:cytochrome c-type biogenesis protein CcmF
LTYIGYQALIIALVLSLYATILFFAAGRKPFSKYIASAQRAVIAVAVLVVIASIALWYALFTRDFQIEYVAHYSNRALTWFYTIAAFWAGQAGSLLFWGLLLALFSVIVLAQNYKKNSELLPITLGIMSATTFFFLYLLVFKSNPFARLAFLPPDGQGLNPLLQNPQMVFHPPTLYLGFVAFTVPFAFAMSALWIRRLDNQLLKTIRRWTLASWLFLTIGNILGMQWAYVELGWGGYWAWDPVENASLMPWLTGTAFLHSIIVQERKGMLKRWTISLVVMTFALTIFGTFVTRSGLISSVHAFGVSDLGPLFLGFLAVIIIFATVMLSTRGEILKGNRDIGSWTSKESSFLLNNLLFVAITLGVFIGTLMPSLSELFRGEQMTVGSEFFNRMATPIGLGVFLLIGVCTALSWTKTSTEKLLRNLLLPLIIAVVFLALFTLMGIRGFIPLVSLAIAVFSITITIQDYIRGVIVHSRQQSINFITAIVSLTRKHKRRYGGYIVHLGVLALLLGLIGSSAFTLEKQATVRKNDIIRAGDYDLQFQGITRERGKDRFVDSANFSISKDSKIIGSISSEKHLFENFQPSTEVGIRSTLKEDLYVMLGDYDIKAQMATVGVLVNPLVIWIWIGGLIMVFGTLLAIVPDKRN